jgi:hypothetical protein
MWVCVAVLYCVSVECEVPECWIVEETRRKFALMMQEFSTQGTEDTAYITHTITRTLLQNSRSVEKPLTIYYSQPDEALTSPSCSPLSLYA